MTLGNYWLDICAAFESQSPACIDTSLIYGYESRKRSQAMLGPLMIGNGLLQTRCGRALAPRSVVLLVHFSPRIGGRHQ